MAACLVSSFNLLEVHFRPLITPVSKKVVGDIIYIIISSFLDFFLQSNKVNVNST